MSRRPLGQVLIEPPLTHGEWLALKRFAAAPHEGNEYPSKWCDVVPSEEGTALVCSQEEPRALQAWLSYVLQHFLAPRQHIVNGEMHWIHDGYAEIGLIEVVNNEVREYSFADLSDLLKKALASRNCASKQWMLWLFGKVLGMDLHEVHADPGDAPE